MMLISWNYRLYSNTISTQPHLQVDSGVRWNHPARVSSRHYLRLELKTSCQNFKKHRMEGMHGPKEPSVGPPLGVAPHSPGDLEPRVYVNKEMGSANQILLVLVPGALLYPKDYTCLAESLMSSAQASKGVNLSIAMAAVNWSTASFTDPQSLVSAFDSSIDRSIEKAVTEHGVQLMKSPFGTLSDYLCCLSQGPSLHEFVPWRERG